MRVAGNWCGAVERSAGATDVSVDDDPVAVPRAACVISSDCRKAAGINVLKISERCSWRSTSSTSHHLSSRASVGLKTSDILESGRAGGVWTTLIEDDVPGGC